MDLAKIQNLKNQAISAILQTKEEREIENLRIVYLGRKGSITQLISQIPKIKLEERVEFGRSTNEAKRSIEEAIDRQKSKLKILKSKLTEEWVDFTAPGKLLKIGHLHLTTQAIEEITKIFEKIGFQRVAYPEVEWDWYAFSGLNMPPNHPARDEWETFFITGLKNEKYGRAVLTPHTSSGQLREMERVKKALPAGRQAPIRMLNIGKCYRRQSDVSHAPMFHQFEGLLVDKNISIIHLKGTLDYFAREYFGPGRKTRIRPSHFRFTEPSFEVDVSCDLCRGKGCRVCKEGWLELGGAGMVHPQVLENGGINPKRFTAFAFGWGVERVLMMKAGLKLPDLRILYSNDIRFLEQF